MRKLSLMIGASLLMAVCAFGSDQVWYATSHSATSALPVSSSAAGFAGELDQLDVWLPTGVTGTVVIASVAPYTGEVTVLASNAATTGTLIWRPRLAAQSTSGAATLTVTNVGDRILIAGETIRATISDVSATSQIIKFRLKYLK